MNCPKCGGDNVSISLEQVSSKTKKSGVGFGGHMNNMARGVTAVCVLIYRLYKKHQIKEAARLLQSESEKQAAERETQRRREAAEREERLRQREAYRATVNREIFHVVGVTFKNEDGRDRQALLRKIKREQPPEEDFVLREFEYKGERAVGVYFRGEQVGSIAREDLHKALAQIDRFDKVSDYEVTGGFKLDNGDRANYGLDIAVYFKKA